MTNVLSPFFRLSAEDYMLKHKGDWRGYLAMMNGGSVNSSPFFRLLLKYYAESMDSLESTDLKPCDLVMALSVWGDEYIDRMLNYCFPSLLEPANIDALKSRDTVIFIHCRMSEMDKIISHESVKSLSAHGIKIEIVTLSDDLINLIEPHASHKYWHLGLTQSIHLQYAKRRRAAYHLLMPDHVYSEGFFERLMGAGKDIITHSSIPTVAASAAAELDTYRGGVSIGVPPARLMAMALKNMHGRMTPYLLTDANKYPSGHLIVMEGRERVHIMSPHQTLAWMSKEAIEHVPERIFFTLDSELDKIITKHNIYQPTSDDALVMLELSGDIRHSKRVEFDSVRLFKERFNAQISEPRLRHLFCDGMDYPLCRSDIPDRPYLSDADISKIKIDLKGAICFS